MKLYYTGVDNGDGSIGVEFFDSQECIDLLEETDPERYRGEGGGWFETETPIGLYQTIDDVKIEIGENNC